MYKNFLVLLIIVFLQGCGSQTSSYISSGLTLASGGTTAKSIFATGTNPVSYTHLTLPTICSV